MWEKPWGGSCEDGLWGWKNLKIASKRRILYSCRTLCFCYLRVTATRKVVVFQLPFHSSLFLSYSPESYPVSLSIFEGRYSSVKIWMGQVATGIRIPMREIILLSSPASISALGLTQPLSKVYHTLVPQVESVRGTKMTPHFQSLLKNTLSYTSVPPYVYMVWFLIKHRSKCTYIS
jgi:hypothetical protein